MTLILWTNPMSRGRIARWMLEETGVPYETRIVAYGEEMEAPAFRALNPLGKVPVLEHDGQVVSETAAICAYLAEAFPEAGLAPTPGERAAYLRIMFFAAGPAEAAITNMSAKYDPPADMRRRFGYGNYADAVDALEALVPAEGFLAGPRFTAADVYAGSQILFGTEFGGLPKRPAFEAYLSRILARPALQRAKGLDDADAAAMAG